MFFLFFNKHRFGKREHSQFSFEHRFQKDGEKKMRHLFFNQIITDSLNFSNKQKEDALAINTKYNALKDSLMHLSEQNKDRLTTLIYAQNPNKQSIDSVSKQIAVISEQFNVIRLMHITEIRKICSLEQNTKITQLLTNFNSNRKFHKRRD
ncbi:MAG: hypothetical protein JSU07_05435 [Bacteroidetes bacterium]|nr:hypothetical protein [Bacteroidota bacterium]